MIDDLIYLANRHGSNNQLGGGGEGDSMNDAIQEATKVFIHIVNKYQAAAARSDIASYDTKSIVDIVKPVEDNRVKKTVDLANDIISNYDGGGSGDGNTDKMEEFVTKLRELLDKKSHKELLGFLSYNTPKSVAQKYRDRIEDMKNFREKTVDKLYAAKAAVVGNATPKDEEYRDMDLLDEEEEAAAEAADEDADEDADDEKGEGKGDNLRFENPLHTEEDLPVESSDKNLHPECLTLRDRIDEQMRTAKESFQKLKNDNPSMEMAVKVEKFEEIKGIFSSVLTDIETILELIKSPDCENALGEADATYVQKMVDYTAMRTEITKYMEEIVKIIDILNLKIKT